jgi:hypothetical protein
MPFPFCGASIMNVRSIFFITLLHCLSFYSCIQGSRRYADYNIPVVVDHPFADVYTRLEYLGKKNPVDPFLASVPMPKQISKNQSTLPSLPAIHELKQIDFQPHPRLFENSIRLESLSDNDTTLDLPSERSTDISSQSTFHESTKSDGTSTIQQNSIQSEQSTIATSSTSKFSSKKFTQISTTTTSNQAAQAYKIAPEPELWITNNQDSLIQITIYLRTPLHKNHYDQNDPLTYDSSSQRMLIEPGQQIKVPVPFDSKLYSIQILYDPIKQTIKTRKHFFNGVKDINFSKNVMNVGEKQYAHNIDINTQAVNLDRVSSTKKQELMQVSLDDFK